MTGKDEQYAFPWGFHLGDLHKDHETIPLYTVSSDGGFCLLYDDASETKADKLLESLCLELLSTMPHESLQVNLFDFGKSIPIAYPLSSNLHSSLHTNTSIFLNF